MIDNLKEKFTNHIGKTLATIYVAEAATNKPHAINNNIFRLSHAICFVSLREFFKFVSFVDFPIPMNEIIILYKS